MKKNQMKGISLIALVITILVSLILVSVAVAATGNAIENANITQYIDNLTLVKDSVEAYYITNGSFPLLEENSYNQGEILNLIGSKKTQADKDTFLYDMRQNEDYLEDDKLGDYYIIDIAKLDIEKSDIGNRVRSDLDVFAFSYPSMNIYYLEGKKIKGDIYFSLNKRLTYISNISNNMEENDVSTGISVQTLGNITITKNNSLWTGNLGLTITGEDVKQQNVSIRISGSEAWHTVTKEISAGDAVNKIIDFNYNNKLGTALSQSEINSFNITASTERYIEVKTGESTLKVDLSNYDDRAPEIRTCTVTNNPEMSIVSYGLDDYDSGIREIRYDYLTKFDENGNITNYYDFDIQNDEYMLTKSKKVRALGQNNLSIKIPKNVNKIVVYVIDNAGNFIREHDRVVKAKYVSIGAKINYFYSDGFNFSLDIVGDYASIETSVITEKDSNLDFRTTFDEVPKDVDYRGFTNGIESIYLKVKVISVSNGRPMETVKNFQFDLLGNYPYVPAGFYYVGGTSDTGFIISDNVNDKSKSDSFEISSSLLGNQFVWIPVDIDSSSVQNLKTKWFRTSFESGSEYNKTTTRSVLESSYTEPLDFNGIHASSSEIRLYNDVLAGIQKYKGFYVGRYEAGVDHATSARTKEDVNKSAKIGIRKELYAYNWINFSNSATDISSGASYLANNMYNNNFVGSNLIFGIQWDQVMKFVNKNVSNSRDWGNYLDSTGEAEAFKGAYDYKTGRNKEWCANNIYDLAGNLSEWTMESYANSARVTRGGNYSQMGTTNSAGSRLAYEPKTASELIGFRVCLYLK